MTLYWLADPPALLLLLALPLLGVLAVVAWWARRRAWRQLSGAAGRIPLVSRHAMQPLLRGLLITTGLLLVGFAAAGPQWGREKTTVVSAARDLVVVLDVSRSMLAESPSRQLRAQRVLGDLANTLKQRGGHRVALVVFAARAKLVVPLTTDYDLFEQAVLQQNAARLPAELRPGKDGPASGTRLGEGLQQAVATHDPKYRGSQVILLVSDGDDPADDGEWKDGIVAARRAGIPVFVVGVGDPTKASKIRIGDALLTYGGQPVETTLHEEVLKEIANRTDGTYFPVRTQKVAAQTLFPALLEAAGSLPREAPPAEAYRPRFHWFLAVGLVLLAASTLIADRRAIQPSAAEAGMELELRAALGPRRAISLAGSAAIALAAVVQAGAAPEKVQTEPLTVTQPASVETALRQGNEAFHHKDYGAALKFYQEAEDGAADPGQVAFNKGAALFRVGRLREAELCYWRCLEDRAAPLERRLRAWYDLGAVMLQRGADAKDPDALLRAAECFESCREEAPSDNSLRDDAEHNLELARLLWLKVRAEVKPTNDKALNQEDQMDPRRPFKQKGPRMGDPGAGDAGDNAGERLQSGQNDPAQTDQRSPGPGTVDTLVDSDQLQPLDVNDARAILAREIRRIEQAQAQGPGQVPGENKNVKDW